ncbi:MAG: hypothetical protein ACRDN6_08960 [Gaiellaceae bacterium]
MRKLLATLCAVVLTAGVAASGASAQHEAGNSLVNVQVGDITILVPIAVAANLCDINVNVLAQQLETGDTSCDADAESIASPGTGDGGGAGHTAGDSLVNVQIGDITAQLPIAVAANVCDVAVNVLARQLQLGPVSCTAVADSTA